MPGVVCHQLGCSDCSVSCDFVNSEQALLQAHVWHRLEGHLIKQEYFSPKVAIQLNLPIVTATAAAAAEAAATLSEDIGTQEP